MKNLYLCKWRFYGATEYTSFYMRANSIHAAFDHMIRRYAQDNPLIQLCRPVEIDPITKQEIAQ